MRYDNHLHGISAIVASAVSSERVSRGSEQENPDAAAGSRRPQESSM